MDVAWTTRRPGERTLVELTLTTDRPREVRVEPTSDAFAPPRTDGVPEAGWDGDGFTGVVDGRLGLGFTTDAVPEDPPVRVDWRGPPDERPAFDSHPDVPGVEATAGGVARSLSDPRPPREAVPRGRPDPADGTATGDAEDGHAATDEESGDAEADDGTGDAGKTLDRDARRDEPSERDLADGPPAAAGLAALERRVALAERLAEAETLAEATAAVAAAGGLDGVRALDDALARDRERLADLLERVGELRERADGVDVPTATLSRLGGEAP